MNTTKALAISVFRSASSLCLLALVASAAHGETLNVTLTAPSPVIEETADGTRISLSGFHSLAAPGQPSLPAQVVRIAVPPDIDWATLQLRTIQGEPQALVLPSAVAPATPDLAGAPGGTSVGFAATANLVNGRDMAVYGLAALYPASPIRLLPYGQLRKWRYVQVEFSPMQWNPISGAAQFWPAVQVELEFQRAVPPAGAPSAADDPLLADAAMDDVAASLLVNFDQAASWYTPSANALEQRKKSFVANYLIVTTTTIVNNCPKLQEFIAHKTALGNTVAVVTESDFNSVVGQAPNHRAEKIRKWLADHYASWGFYYVLLIGNPTPYENGEGDIPMKMTWPKWSDTEDREAPTDMFYGDLTGNWDIDGDQLYGEWSDYTTSGGVDLTPEVYVGRIPVYAADYNGLRDVLQKIMDFDNEASVAWRKNVLLPMSFSGEGFDGAPLAQQMWDDYLNARGYGRWRQYQQGSGACGANSAYASDQELRGGNVVRDRWAANDYGIVCWWAHGNVDVAAVGYDKCWDGDLFNSGMTGSLDDNHPSFTFQCSCLNGYPENSNNLQYQLLRRGAIATVSATRVSFFNTGYGYGSFDGASINAGIGYEYIKRLTDGQTAGRALVYGKMAVVGDIGSRNTRLMNQFDFNLYGDPSSQINMVREYFPLANNTPWTMTAVPRRFSFPVYSYDWACVAIRPSTEEHDVKADTDVGLPSPYETSAMSGVQPNFVVANGHLFGDGTHYAEVSHGSATPYVIEAENDIGDLTTESWYARSLRTNDVIDLMEVPVQAGHTYEVAADVTSGTPDLKLFVFAPNRTSGSRTDYDGFRDAAGAGGDEVLTYTAPAAGDLAVLVVNGNGVAGNYNLRVRDATPLPAPSWCSASDGTQSNRVSISWNSVSSATSYCLYRNTANNSAGASALTAWITTTNFDDYSAQIGTCYYYWVKAAVDNTGFRASAFSAVETGYVAPATLVDDVKVNISTTPSFFQFAQSSAYWAAVGVRQEDPADNWSLRFYSAPDFLTQLSSSAYVVPVDFVVIDRNHVPNVYRGIEAYRYSGSGPAAVEFDGGSETLSLGLTTGIDWPAGDVVEMRDINLSAGSYRFTLKVTAGAADLDFALFGSGDGTYYRNREQYLARSTQPGGRADVFYVSLTNADWYGLCVWANDTNSATYSLEAVPVTAGLWEGDISDDWHTPGNWNDNTVPVAGTDVTIPPGTLYSPRIYRQIAYCSNVTVQAGATLTIYTNQLYAGGNAHVHGALNMNHDFARFHLGGDMVWESGSTASMIGSARILVTGDWNFEAGATVQLTGGYVEFEGAGTSFIRCYDANCNLHNLNCSKYSPYYLGVSGLCTEDLPVNNLYIYSGTQFRCYSAQNVIIRGFMNNMGGVFQWLAGGVVFTGYPGVVPLNPTGDSYFRDLIQNGTGPLVFASAYTNYLRVVGSVTIASSAIDCANLGIGVGGNWNNEVGRSGFLCRTGSVTFIGSSSQYVLGSNVFNIVWDARGGVGTLWLSDDIVVSNAWHVTSIHGVQGRLNVLGTLDLNAIGGQFAVYSGGDVTAAHFDQGGHLYLFGGQFLASDLADGGLFGQYTINEGTATLQQDSGQYIDLNAIVDIQNGTLRVVGGNGYSYWPYSANASLRMTGGVLDFDGPGIRVHNSPSFVLTNSITGGRIRTSGDFVSAQTAFNPPGGTVELYGLSSTALNLVPGSSLHSLGISKRAATVTATTNVVLTGDFTLGSGAFTAPPLMSVSGNWSNNVSAAAFVEGLGTVVFDGANPADILTDETFYNLQVNKTYTGFDALELADGIHVTASNTLTCVNGSLEMNPGSVLNVRGNLTLARGAGLNANDLNTSIYVGGSWVNQNTNRTIYNGFEPGNSSRVTFDGTGSFTLASDCPAEEFWDVVIDRPGGALRPLDSIYINGQLSISNGFWSSFVGGLQHQLRGNLYVHTTGAWGDSSPANTIRFAGGTDATINYAGTNGYFSNITIDKSSGASVRLLSDIHQLGGVGLTVAQGTYSLGGHLDRVTGGVTVGSNAVLVVDAGATLELGGSSNLMVLAGGRLEAIGAAGNPATISRQSGNYNVLVQSNATIAARQAIFEYLNTDGVFVMAGATVDPTATFDDCTFRFGVAGGSLLRVENDQTFTAMRPVFPSNAGGGSNVRKSSNQGRVLMRDATGAFAGEAFDNDPFNRIDWSLGLLTSVTLNMPGYVTLGGQYQASASVAPGDASEPISYFWTVTENPSVQHIGGLTPDANWVAWNTSGGKTVQVIASNRWGTVTVSKAVLVQPLRIKSIERQYAGTNVTVRLVIEGTTPYSQYEVQSTPNLGLVPWAPILPHGSGWPGSETNTTWLDHSEGDRILESTPIQFYRVKVLPPDIIP